MALSRRRKLTIVTLILYWPALFILAHIPIPQLVRRAHVSDKSLHFLAYLILAFLFWFAFYPEHKVNWRRVKVWWVLLVIACYGVIDELLQGCMAGRSCDIRDYIANLVGTFTGLILLSLLSFWWAFLAVVGITIFALTNITRANLTDLIPITNAMFHFFAYGLLTIIWIRCISLFFAIKAPATRWFIAASALPTVFLLSTKLFSIILGKEISVKDVVISVTTIAATIFAAYLIFLLRRLQEKS